MSEEYEAILQGQPKKYLSFSFTELLYGVLIGEALRHVHELSPSRSNLLLLITVILVADDYFGYHKQVKDLSASSEKELKLFLLDMLVLSAWYSLALSSQYAGSQVDLLVTTINGAPITLYLIWLTLYYLAITVWERFFPDPDSRGRLPIMIAGLLCAILSSLWPGPDWIYLILFLLLFLSWRLPTYIKNLRVARANQPEAEHDSASLDDQSSPDDTP